MLIGEGDVGEVVKSLVIWYELVASVSASSDGRLVERKTGIFGGSQGLEVVGIVRG